MTPILEGLIPVFFIIALGWATCASGFITKEQWNGFERVTYQILIPGLMITTLAMADLSRVPIPAVVVTLVAPVFILGGLIYASRPMLQRSMGIEGPAFTSVLQGSIRWNSFVAIALTGALYGKDGVALTAVAFAVLIPAVNLLSAYGLAKYGSDAKPVTAVGLALNLIKNPFIWSTLIGIALSIIALPIPKALATTGDILGRAALAAGLLLVGSGLDLKSMQHAGAPLWIANVLKLIVLPLMALAIGKALGLTGTNIAVTVICSSVPTAAASYILARQNGGDATLMATIIAVQTILAAVTMPLMLLLL